MARRATKLLIALALSASLGAIAPASAFAYVLLPHKIYQNMWYQPSAAFYDESKESMRLAMATWNNYMPVGKRACFDATSHANTTCPFWEGKNYIYKVPLSDMSIVGINHCRRDGLGVPDALLESDINLNANQPWDNGLYDGKYDVRTIMLHEIGHTFGLGDVTNSSAVMYGWARIGDIRWNLTSDDIAGLEARYS